MRTGRSKAWPAPMIRRCFTEVHGSKAAKLEGRSFLGKKKGGKAGHGTYVLLIMCL